MSERRFLLLLGAAWLVIGLAAYWPILRVGFLGDDWMFLDLVSRAHNASVLFAPLNSRYTRPLIVLVYYLNYWLFGLWPVPAHLVVVLLHVFNAWLVSLLVLRLAPPPNRVMAAGAGLIFLLFAGHSEAIAWVAGMADAAVVPFIVGSLLLFDRALDAERLARWMAAAWIVGLAGLLAKETSAVVLPALVFCYGLVPRAQTVPPSPLPGYGATSTRQRLLRTAAFVAVIVVSCAAYLYIRALRFGPMLNTMTGMGTSEGQRVAIARMFFVRAFAPPGRPAYALWLFGWDRWLLAAALLAAAAVAIVYKRDRWRLAFVVAALLVAIAPALPFSISITTTLTERYLYLTTVFSSILVAWLIVRLVPVRPVAVALLAIAAAGQWVYLARSNATWVRGDEVFRSVVSGIASIAERNRPMDTSAIVLLNMPDTINRGCVDAAGVPTALHLSGALPDPGNQLRMIAVHDSPPKAEPVVVQRDGTLFRVDLGSGRLIEPPCLARTTAEYAATSDDPHRLDVRMQAMTRRAIVVYATGDAVREAAVLDAHPFGFVDLPANDATCEAGALRVAGWALDDREGLDVRIEREDAGGWTPIGSARRERGTRPDVTGLFPGYPAAGGPAWEFQLPCSGIHAATRFRVVARDSAGQEAILGVRTVRRP
jgi:hypothetical protein